MKKMLVALSGVALLAGAGIAVAQAPAPPAPPGPAAEVERGPAERGEHGWRGMMHRMHHMPPPSKAARFMFRKGEAVVSIKCADDEPMKACVDAASALMDKLATAAK